jgi:hypothetical protein
MRVLVTPVRVKITLVRVKITLVRLKITVTRVGMCHFQRKRVIFTLWRVDMHTRFISLQNLLLCGPKN